MSRFRTMAFNPSAISELLDTLELRKEGFNRDDDFGKIAYYYSSHVHSRKGHAEKLVNGYINHVIQILRMFDNDKLIKEANEFSSSLIALDIILSNSSELIKDNFSHYFKHSQDWGGLKKIISVFRKDFDQFGNFYECWKSSQFEEMIINDSAHLYSYLTGQDPKKHINKFMEFSRFICQAVLENGDQFNISFKAWSYNKAISFNVSWLRSMANLHPEWNIQKKYLQDKT